MSYDDLVEGIELIAGPDLHIGLAIIYRHKDHWYFKLAARNGEPLCKGSEPYNSKQACKKTIKKFFPDFKIVDK